MLKNITIFSICCTLFFACKKDNTQSAIASGNNYAAAIQIVKGSYWIYDDGDSVCIANDTLIKGKSFHVRKSFFNSDVMEEFFRDSSPYIFDMEGNKVFSGINFKDTLFKNVYYKGQYAKMYSPDSIISVPAGSFKSVVFMDHNLLPGHYFERDYANGIGIIRELQAGERAYHTRRLVRYKIK